jgi:hypothetical protein
MIFPTQTTIKFMKNLFKIITCLSLITSGAKASETRDCSQITQCNDPLPVLLSGSFSHLQDENFSKRVAPPEKNYSSESAKNSPEIKTGNLGAGSSKSIIDAIKDSKPYIDLRHRYEYVDQKGIENNANASTLRTKIGVKTGEYKGVSAVLEGQNILAIGGEKYNSGVNSKTNYPTVPDAENSWINQAYLGWKVEPKTKISLGRQSINLDNQRFIGSVAWRQNDQTLDGVNIKSEFFNNFSLFYMHSNRINRVFGSKSAVGKFEGNIDLFNGSYDGFKGFKITAYNYLLGVDELSANSSKTTGARVAGSIKINDSAKFLLALEYADQRNYKNNPTTYRADYYLIEPGFSVGNFMAKLGREVLSGNGTTNGKGSFQTPLATLHAFNGWADKFLTTPANGLVDNYGSLEYKIACEHFLKNTTTQFVYHDFLAQKTNDHYGREYDFQVLKEFNKNLNIGAKLAHYSANQLYTNTTKFMLTTQVKF